MSRSAKLGLDLAVAVGAAHVATSDEGGREIVSVRPGAAPEVAAVLAVARSHRARVSVAAPAGDAEVVLDAARMVSLLELDEVSMLVHAQAGIRMEALEAAVTARGMTLGAIPRTTRARTLGAVLAAPRPSEATPRRRFVDACAALDAVLADGTLIATRLAPRKATGPDFNHALLGARGATGIITGAWLRLARAAPYHAYAGWAIPVEEGVAVEGALRVARQLLDGGIRPADLVIADAVAAARVIGSGAIASTPAGRETLLGARLDGVEGMCDAERAAIAALVAATGGRELSPALAEAWFREPPDAKHQRFVPLPSLATAWASRRAGDWLCGVAPAGATLMTDSAGALLPVSPALAAIRAALRRRLDPGDLFATDGGG